MSLKRASSLLASLFLALGCAQILGIDKTELDPEYGEDDVEPPADDDADDEADASDDNMDDDAGDGASDSGAPDADAGDVDQDSGIPQPVVDAGPPERGSDFRCVGDDWLTRADADTIEIVATIIDLATGDPVEGLTMTECRTRLDQTCGGASVQSDVDGVARLEVRSGFNGYLKIEGPDASATEYVGYLWYFSQPLYNTYSFPILAMTPPVLEASFYSGVSRGADRGEVAVQVTDCTEDTGSSEFGDETILNAPGVPAPGLTLEVPDGKLLDEQSREFYFSDNIPLAEEVPSDRSTDISGLGGFLNVKAGPVSVRARNTATGQIVGSDTLLVRAGFLTTARLLPDPN